MYDATTFLIETTMVAAQSLCARFLLRQALFLNLPFSVSKYAGYNTQDMLCVVLRVPNLCPAEVFDSLLCSCWYRQNVHSTQIKTEAAQRWTVSYEYKATLTVNLQ